MKAANEIKLTALPRKQISLAIMVALGAISNLPVANAGPGIVCSDGALPIAQNCANGATAIPTYYANSPKLRKFVDTLPGLTPTGTNTFADGTTGSYIPVAVKDNISYPGSSYYELAVVEYTQKMHSDLKKATTLRGYIQIDRATTDLQVQDAISNAPLSLKYPDGTQIYVAKEKGLLNGVYDHTLVKDSSGKPVMVPAIALDKPHYLGPTIIAEKGVPTRIKMNNLLPKGRASLDTNGKVVRNGDIFLPVDESLPGAGNSTVPLNTFPQNRVAIHLHGGDSPWISDGTPHQWFSSETDATINPLLKRGDRALNVPDMPYPGEAAQTLFWPNDQSARLMWYHDHSFGLTRQNAYSGEAAPYLITDATEDALLSSAVPVDMIPLVIQDKTFVANDIAKQDSKWDQAHWGAPGDLWYPHVYEPNIIDHDSNTGAAINPPVNNNAGRWDYGPTSLPVSPAVLALPDGSYGHASVGPEAYMDTAMVNGVAYPTMNVDPKAYRVRLLNGANDRYFNLSLWVADDTVKSTDGRFNTEVKLVPEMLPSTFTITNGGSGYVAPQVVITDQGGYGNGATASAQVDVNGAITAITLNNSGSGYVNPQVQIADISGTGAVVSIQTIIGRPEGVPDPVNAGPAIIQFGNEAGLLPRPVIHSPKAMNYNLTTETGGGFYLGNAERGDTVIDFSQYAGKTLILYNDSSAPVPDGDSRYDYFTGNPDQSAIGGSVSTQTGYGPNTRTVMQIKVSTTSTAAPAYDATGRGGPLETVLPSVYIEKADSHIEQGIIANGKFSTSTLADWKTAHPGITLSTKTIEGGFDVNFGRLIANFGVELPAQIGSTPLAYIDKTTDIVEDGKIQYWHIKNNDADNHPIHFHLFNVQVITRVDHATGLLINPNPNEAGWKETVQNWPAQDVIVALKPKTPALPFGLPDSVRLMDPTLNAGDTTNTSLAPNYINAGTPASATPLAFQQYDLVTGAFVPPNPITGAPGVVNDLQNFGWEYVYHCHILGHEENDLMRPMKFLPIPSVKPDAPISFALDITNGKATWTDSTPINGADVNGISTKGNPKNEIGFRIEYAPNINGVVNPASYTNAAPLGSIDPITTIPDNILRNNLLTPQKSKINSVANTVSFNTNLKVLNPNTDFVYRVVTVNQASETPSATVPFAQAPAAVANLNASAILANGLTLTWTDASNETGYAVEFSSDNGVTWQAQGTVPANTTGGTISYPVTGLSQATTYLFRVGTIKTGFSTALSQSINATTLKGVTVTQPANLTATSPTGVGVTLTWTDMSNNETSFQVERAEITNGNIGVFSALPNGAVARTKTLGTATAGLVTFQDTTTIIGVSYAYHVKAINLTGTINSYSASSNMAAFTLTLSAPTSFTGIQSVANIALNWLDTSNNETGFQISRNVVDPISKATIGTAILIPIPSSATQKTAVNAARTYTDATALPGVTYSYSIASVNGVVSSTLVAMTPATISMPINPPTLPVATITNATKINLAWTDLSTNETGFVIERSITVASNASPWTALTTVARSAAQKTGINTAVSYADNLVAPIIPGSYQYRVTAINATGTVINGSSSPVISAPLDFTAPSAPSALGATVTAAVTGVVNLSWTDNASNETGFTLQRATNAAFTTGLVTTKIVGANAASTFNYPLTALKKGSVFYFRVQATNTVGVSNWASTVIPTTVP